MPSVDFRAPRDSKRKSRRNTAFIVETLLLLVFLIASLAIAVNLFAASIDKSTQSLHLERAVNAAANAAERFAANPTAVAAQEEENGLVVTCEVTPEKTQAGTLYNANITVYDDFDEIYSLQTAVYEGKVSS